MGIDLLHRFGSLCVLVAIISCTTQSDQLPQGVISSSTIIPAGHYRVTPESSLDTAVINVRGDNVVLDFEGAVLDARHLTSSPDSFDGIAIRIINSRNVEIRNLKAHGFKIAIYAENSDGLRLVNCDLSYNYRPRLHSKWDREALSDWLYYHNNENDEWLRYAGAIFLKNCQDATIKGNRVVQGFNGLMMVRCNGATVYNNEFRFNSGLGIGMYRSSSNRILHNRLDWNVRGYSHGQYDRGQDSAGILLYEQCNDNIIAYNSATHSGDGLFLWAGQHTMDTGEGGCNNNLIYKNDFSHSVANGIEVTFSSNIIVENKLNDCRYGIWGGYSFDSYIIENEILDCDHGIAIEHGNNIVINGNHIGNTPSAIELWERESQPEGWGFAENRNVDSRSYNILNNKFVGCRGGIRYLQN